MTLEEHTGLRVQTFGWIGPGAEQVGRQRPAARRARLGELGQEWFARRPARHRAEQTPRRGRVVGALTRPNEIPQRIEHPSLVAPPATPVHVPTEAGAP